nr:DUF937 domain-containing protein [Propionibacterium sp.]
MGATQDILASLDIDQLARALGADPGTVESAATEALSSLLGGLQSNMEADDSAISLANALGDHIDDDNAAPQTGAIDLARLDFTDGAKIVNHILPAPQQQQLFGGSQGSLIQKLMPLLAPIVMAYLAKRLQSSGGLGSVLGGLLGGQAPQQQAPQQQAPSGGLGDLLGQILGGGAPAQQVRQETGGLGDLLGQILGGGQQVPAPASSPQGGGLRMDDTYAPQAQQQDVPSVGGLLKSILFG